ncbi:MAG: DciA family protein [Ignavibacteria bacterium]|jgi:hypothetical protein
MTDGFKSLKEVYISDPNLKNVRKIVKSSDVIIDFLKIFPDWEQVVTPVKVDKMFLKLRVENSVLRSELKFKEKEIIDKINQFYNEERVKGIKFTN